MLFAAKQMREADLKVSMVDSLEIDRAQALERDQARALRILAQRDFDLAVADEQRAEARLIATKAKAASP